MSTLDAAIALIVFVSFIEWLAITLKLYQIEEKMSLKQKMPFKDWCHNCQSLWKSSEWCKACQYKLLREMVVNRPPHFKEKTKEISEL